MVRFKSDQATPQALGVWELDVIVNSVETHAQLNLPVMNFTVEISFRNLIFLKLSILKNI